MRLLPLIPLAVSLQATAPPKTLRAQRLTGAIRLDGRLDEGCWTQASVLSDFTQLTPMLGAPSAKHTEVQVLFDDRFLYVGARMHHPKGRADVVRQVHRRDQSSASDWFALFLDSAHDHLAAFSFMVNAAGVQRDGVHFDDGSDDWSWDGVWASAVSVDEGGWTAELQVPLSLLRFHNAGGSLSWGANFGRRDEGAARETSYWYSPPRGENAWVSRFHHLVGLEGLQPQARREWIPYLSVQNKFETAQAWDDRGWTARVGLDAHLGVSSNTQLDLTLRPDFGQVEVDQAVLNLTTVETFFPEKRPFFLEGMEIFKVPFPTLFYSRRLGQGVAGPAPDQDVVDWPLAQEIAAAGKFTTKLPGGLALGVLGAGVEAARGTVRDVHGDPVEVEVAPYTSAAVARATQSVDGRGSYVGAFASYLSQSGPTGRTAGVGALDGAWKSPGRSTRVEGVFAHSAAGPKGSLERGDFLKVHGVTAWGSGWNLDANAFTVAKAFNPNDLGYLDRPDRNGFTFDLDRRWDSQRGAFRNPMLRLTYCEFRDRSGGKPYTKYWESWGKVETTREWAFFAGAGVMATVFDDRELRTFADPVKKYLRIPSAHWVFAGLDTPPNAVWTLSLQWNRVGREGGPKDEVQLVQALKPMSRLELRLETAYTHSQGEWHWLETQGTTPIVGTRKLSQLDQVTRVAYAFSPTLTVQFFSQWLAGNWAFRDLRSYVDDDTLAPGAVAQGPAAASDRLWSLNLITRWEFRPGSALYAVYTHGAWTDALINDRGTLSPANDLPMLRHLPSDDVVQVKLSWLFR